MSRSTQVEAWKLEIRSPTGLMYFIQKLGSQKSDVRISEKLWLRNHMASPDYSHSVWSSRWLVHL